MKLLLFLLILFFCFDISLAQETNQIKTLEIIKKELSLRIAAIEDSIKSIDVKINKAKSLELIKKINDSSLVAYTTADALLKKKPNVNGEIIKRYKKNTKAIILDFESTYFRVCIKSICGFMSEAWLRMDDSTYKTFTSRKNSKSSLLKYSSNSISPNTKKSKSSSYKKSSRFRYKRSRTYYKGPRGGCYYINSNGNKTYVSRGLCN